MDHDSDALQKSLLQLAVEAGDNLPCPPGQPPDDLSEPEALLILEPEAGAVDRDPSEIFASQKSYLLKLGDIPAVQDRFERLLKNRLASEAQRNPPLFPWETEIHDYETEGVTSAVGAGLTRVGASAQLWMTQLKQFGLPVALPETLLAQLFQRCQDVAQSSLLEGAKLVQAVESLFPGEAYALNDLAGLVMTAPARSGNAPVVDYPASYEAAAPNQQMVLSLLAARELLGALTLGVSPRQPTVERQWLTEVGSLKLVTHYTAQDAQVRLQVQGSLPCGGSLTLATHGQRATTELAGAGDLGVELVIRPGQPCTLEVCLAGDAEQGVLVFAVCTDAD
jgi:hypothetical protein